MVLSKFLRICMSAVRAVRTCMFFIFKQLNDSLGSVLIDIIINCAKINKFAEYERGLLSIIQQLILQMVYFGTCTV